MIAGSGNPLLGEDVVAGDRFPVGLRVLAVDDDQTCLKVLEQMLRKCQYHVTTTTQSIKALEMLRKNRNEFDLVISDVKMPDMDGFKLLEQVGLEMDLPVIMLSGYSNTEYVMKGVVHGACDYLMKPVRIEELQNIWQHVVRKKIDCKDQNKATNEEKICSMAGVGSQGITSENMADQNKKLGLKRKEKSEEEEEDGQESGQENAEPSTRKKPRLVWDAELKRKFDAAVNQLGLKNAYPKKILDLMNVEGLTRENVASHLQKYKVSLKKQTKQARTVAALGNSDPYLQMGSVSGYGYFRTLSGSSKILSNTLPPYASGGIFCRPNSPSGLNLRGISPSALVQPVQSQNINSSIKAFGNMKLPMFSANQSSSLLQGIQTSKEVNQFQQNNCPTGLKKLSPIDDSSAFTVSSGFPDNRATVVNANNSLSYLSSNHPLLQGNSPLTHNSGAFRNHSSVGGACVKTESFNPGISGSSNLLDYNRSNECWQSAAQLSNFPANSPPLSEDFNNDQLSHSRKSPVDFSSTSAVAPLLKDARGELQCQQDLLGNIIPVSLGHSSPSITQLAEVENFYSDARINSNQACLLQRMDSLEGLLQNSSSEMVKQGQNETKFIDGEMEFDTYLLDHPSDFFWSTKNP